MARKLLARRSKKMELLDIYLNESKLTRDKDFDSSAPAQTLRQHNKLAVKADIRRIEDNPDDKSGLLWALVTVGLRFVSSPD